MEKEPFDKLRVKTEKLVLIDGNAIIHRAYHALPKNMSTSQGEPTNATYGFTTTLIKVLEDLKPDHIVCSFDLAGPTFRHEAYADYKATRVKADQELYDQIPRVKEIVRTMNIPIYEKEGFEADDVIGTIVQKIANRKSQITKKKDSSARPKGYPSGPQNDIMIYIVSGDKDIYQLINGNVCVYSLRRGLSNLEIIDSEKIKKEYGLDPHDFVDLKALAGDASDNIPGVPGIGAKTATTLIQKFDTLNKLYDHIEKKLDDANDIKPRIKDLLIKHKDQAFLSQKLATIHRDVPIDFNLEEAKWGDYDKDKLRELFLSLGFRSLLARFGAVEDKTDRKPTEEQKKKDQQLKLL
jgi:DNA polymerase-1